MLHKGLSKKHPQKLSFSVINFFFRRGTLPGQQLKKQISDTKIKEDLKFFV
jgi:hypothetical protein